MRRSWPVGLSIATSSRSVRTTRSRSAACCCHPGSRPRRTHRVAARRPGLTRVEDGDGYRPAYPGLAPLPPVPGVSRFALLESSMGPLDNDVAPYVSTGELPWVRNANGVSGFFG